MSAHVPWRMIWLASLGGALEFYDFVVFGVFAPAIGAAFFPASDPLVSQMLSYGGFAIGYFARPVGGVVLGHFGDRIGRRRVFIGSVLVVSVVTLAMGCVPGYAQWGIAAPLLLLLLRMVQGFCLGGELPGAITYVVETVPRRASFVCGVVFCCVNSGVLLATLVALAVQQTLPAEAIPEWGWRIGFWFGGALGLVGYRLRRALLETPAFVGMQQRVARLPLGEVLGSYPGAAVVGIAVTAATACFNGLLFVHMPGYLTRVLHHSPARVSVAQNLGILVLSGTLLIVAWLGDRVPRRRLLGAGAALLLLGAWPWYAAAGQAASLMWLLIAAALAAALATGVFGVVVADLFPTRVRYSGIAFAYNVSFTAFSGTAPLLATAAIYLTGNVAAPALVMAGCAALTLLGSLWVGRYAGHIARSGASVVPADA
jgi:MFS family permease